MSNKVALCGSLGKHEQNFLIANRELTLRGVLVHSVSVLPRDMVGHPVRWYSPSQKVMLDLIHLRKISESKAILVVGDGYIGPSTAREILWAHVHGYPIYAELNYVGHDQYKKWDRIAEHIRNGYIYNNEQLIRIALDRLEQGQPR